MSRRPPIAALTVSLMAVGPAHAQSVEGGTASLIVSGMAIEGGASLGISGAIGYRFSRTVGVSMELTAVPSFDPDLSFPPTPVPLGGVGGIIIPQPTYTFGSEEGRATIFTANLRLEIPTESRRLVPYVVGGAGVGHVREEFTATVVYPPRILVPSPEFPVTTIYPPPVALNVSRASTGMAVSFGGGLGTRLAEHWSFDADLRYLAVLGDRDLHIGRFGVGVSYRF